MIGISEDEDDDKDKIPRLRRHVRREVQARLGRGQATIAKRYKPETMPSSFLIDRNGIVRFAHVGFHDGEEREVESEVRALLDQ